MNNQIVSNLVAGQTTDFFEQFSPILLTANRDFEGIFQNKSFATGGNINIKIPGYPFVQRGLQTTAQDIQDLVVNYNINRNDIYSVVRNIDLFEEQFNFVNGSKNLTDAGKQAVVDNITWPAFQSLEAAQEITAILRMKLGTFLSPIDRVDKLGSVNSAATINELQNFCDVMKFPRGQLRSLVMNASDYTATVNSLNNSFVEKVSSAILDSGRFNSNKFADFNLWKSVDISPHIAGQASIDYNTKGSTYQTPTITNIDATGLVFTISGLRPTSGVLFKAGDKIAVPSVQLVDPIAHNPVEYTLVLKVAADAMGTGTGTCQITNAFPILASGEHANVASLPSNGAAIEIFPSYRNNYGYARSGLSAVMLPMGDIYGAVNSTNRLANRAPVKVYKQGNILSGSNNWRISSLCAVKVFSPYICDLPSKFI